MVAPHDKILEFTEYGVAFGERIVLADVTLGVAARGVTVLMGPPGGGKSTLLRTACGHNDASPVLRRWGDALYRGRPVSSENRPSLVEQKAAVMAERVVRALAESLPDRHLLTTMQQRDAIHHMLGAYGLDGIVELDKSVVDLTPAQQRQVLILRHVLLQPPLLCIDEPTADLHDDADAMPVLELLTHVATQLPLLVVTHNLSHARKLAGYVALLAGGRIVEANNHECFFDAPQTELAQCFVRTGSCSAPSPYADPGTLGPSVAAPPLTERAAEALGRPSERRSAITADTSQRLHVLQATPPEPPPDAEPVLYPARKWPALTAAVPSGFRWLEHARLAGCPMPGLLNDAVQDLTCLSDLGITRLITLMEAPLPFTNLADYGMQAHHEPIDDMGVPTPFRAAALAQQVEAWLAGGDSIAFHCRAGLGRTGTGLACQLIWRGLPPDDALQRVRNVEPLYIQSDRQLEFLDEFAEYLTREPLAIGGGAGASEENPAA